MRYAFISRIAYPTLFQRLQENKSVDLQTAYDQASALDLVQKNNEAYVALWLLRVTHLVKMIKLIS